MVINMSCKISIVMPCYNADKYIAETIESIKNQSFVDYEVICIDDCSTDNTLKILHDTTDKDDRFRVYKNDVNQGIAKTRNRGIELSEGEYIAFFDNDDIFPEDSLKLRVDFLEEHKEYGVVCGVRIPFYPDGSEGMTEKEVFRDDAYCKTSYLFHNVYHNGCTLTRKSIIDDNQIRFQELLGVEDYRFYADLMKITKVCKLPYILQRYRITDSQYTWQAIGDKQSKRQAIINEIKKDVLNNIMGIEIPKKHLDMVNIVFADIEPRWEMCDVFKSAVSLFVFRQALRKSRNADMRAVYEYTWKRPLHITKKVLGL